jgi:hypothetical protein
VFHGDDEEHEEQAVGVFEHLLPAHRVRPRVRPQEMLVHVRKVIDVLLAVDDLRERAQALQPQLIKLLRQPRVPKGVPRGLERLLLVRDGDQRQRERVHDAQGAQLIVELCGVLPEQMPHAPAASSPQ